MRGSDKLWSMTSELILDMNLDCVGSYFEVKASLESLTSRTFLLLPSSEQDIDTERPH